jgi:hypothetical protein
MLPYVIPMKPVLDTDRGMGIQHLISLEMEGCPVLVYLTKKYMFYLRSKTKKLATEGS